MRLGLSNFLNCTPYLEVAKHHETVIAPPKELASLFFSHKLEASLLSTEAFFSSTTPLFLHPFGIAAQKKTMSVLLFLRNPDEHLHIAVTSSSATSLVLLEVILTHFWQKPFTLFPSLNPAMEKASGYLLIGDEALFHQTSIPAFDLASIWYEYTGLPFVFALFASYEKLPMLSQELFEAWNNFVPELHVEYFNTLDYFLDSHHFKGMTLFHALRQKLPCYH